MKRTRTCIWFSNTKDKWFWQTHSRNSDRESRSQEYFLNTSYFCFYFRCLESKQANTIVS